MGNNLQAINSGEEMKEIQQVQPVSESYAMVQMIERVAMSPDADLSKLEKLLDMRERVENRQAQQQFTSDLASMQIELPRVVENGTGHNKMKYATLEDIVDTTRPVLNKYGFAVTFRLSQTPSHVTVTAVLSHRGGHSESTDIMLPLDTSGSKNGVQAVGSTVSYGKRYAICALLNISTGDDTDGHFATDYHAPIFEALARHGKTQESFEALTKRAISGISQQNVATTVNWIEANHAKLG